MAKTNCFVLSFWTTWRALKSKTYHPPPEKPLKTPLAIVETRRKHRIPMGWQLKLRKHQSQKPTQTKVPSGGVEWILQI